MIYDKWYMINDKFLKEKVSKTYEFDDSSSYKLCEW
jgi:hypothetical protein